MISPSLWDHLLAFLVGIVLPATAALAVAKSRSSSHAGLYFDTSEKIALYWSNSIVLWILAALTVLVWSLQDRALSGLGLFVAPVNQGKGLLLSLAFLVAYGVDAWREMGTERRLKETQARWRRHTPFMPATGREIRHSFVLVASASVCEEIVYRGFLISYASALLGATHSGRWAAVILSAAVFAVCHFYQGLHAAGKILLLGSLFGAIFVITRSLWIPMALHLVVDLIGTLLSPRLLAEEVSKDASTPKEFNDTPLP